MGMTAVLGCNLPVGSVEVITSVPSLLFFGEINQKTFDGQPQVGLAGSGRSLMLSRP